MNCSPTQEFPPTRGLRQGDPLAPLLFLLVVEGLSGLVRQVDKMNLLEGIRVGRNKLNVNMLQFADDTLFFGKPSSNDIVVIKSILRCFELASDLKINFHKSKVGGVGVGEDELLRSSNILNCGLTNVQFKYLGVCVGGNPRRKQFWELVMNKIKKKLTRWKGRFLSFVGRVCLLKSVLTSVPLYYMSLFKMSIIVSKYIMRIQRKFLWGWRAKGRKIAWVKWATLCKPRGEGGLGIKSIKLFNKALLAKWKWRLGIDEKGLWKDILESIYGSWKSQDDRKTIQSEYRWWKDLRKICGSSDDRKWFEENVRWKVGSGSRILFWEDKWTGDRSLKEAYPRLYALQENVLLVTNFSD